MAFDSVVARFPTGPVERMLSKFSNTTLKEINKLHESFSPEASLFFEDMLQNESTRARVSNVANGKEDFIRFAAHVAPVAAHFLGQALYVPVDRWMYLGHVLRLQRAASSVSDDELPDFNRGLVLTVLVDRLSVSQDMYARHLVWLGANWGGIEPYLPLLVERSSVERSFVESALGGASGPPMLSPGIL